jgi:hypothetical protein
MGKLMTKDQPPKLTPEQIKEIQDAPAHYRNKYFARLYKVSVARISQIRKGGEE